MIFCKIKLTLQSIRKSITWSWRFMIMYAINIMPFSSDACLWIIYCLEVCRWKLAPEIFISPLRQEPLLLWLSSLARRTTKERTWFDCTAWLTSSVECTGCPLMLIITSWLSKPALQNKLQYVKCCDNLRYYSCIVSVNCNS